MSSIYAISIILLIFLSNSFVPSTELENESTLYVDGDNIEGPWDGTPDHPYKSIQDAINNASDGDGIFVKEGIYFENIHINKSIELHGENKYSTVIDGKYLNRSNTSTIVYIVASEASFDNFTITYSNMNVYTQDIGSIYINNSRMIQINNSIICKQRAYADAGIIIRYSSDILIENNHIRSPMPAAVGIGFVASSSVQIKHNRIDGDFIYGISGGPENVLIKENVICNASMAITVSGSGPLLENNIWIIGNHIENNGYGILLRRCKNVRIEQNNFIKNDHSAGFNNCISNIWNNNYWDRPRILPVIIKGYIHTIPSIPWFNIDQHPAQNLIIYRDG